MAIKGLSAARELLKKENIVMPFEKGYNEWNKKRDLPAPDPGEELTRQSKEALENQSAAMRGEAARLEKMADINDEKAKEEGNKKKKGEDK